MKLKGKLRKIFDLFLRCQMGIWHLVSGLLTYWLKYHVVLSCGGIGQFNFDNKAIYGSFHFIRFTGTS